MRELRELAKGLLSEGKVNVVIGYEEGPRGIRPAFITSPSETDRLVFDHRCVHNLATYLNPRRAHLRGIGKAAVVLKGCDVRAVTVMLRESQFKREDAVLIGVRCGGVVKDPASREPLSASSVADRCPGCTIQEPSMVDHLVGPALPPPPGEDRREQLLQRLEAMSFDERFAWWQSELERCVRCHACREVCPLCFCERCLADKTDPQWLESSPHLRGNLAWYMNRALHLAGRCVDCMECERVCPSDIPLTLMSRKLATMVAELYGYTPTDDPAVPGPIGTYRTDDQEEFIR